MCPHKKSVSTSEESSSSSSSDSSSSSESSSDSGSTSSDSETSSNAEDKDDKRTQTSKSFTDIKTEPNRRKSLETKESTNQQKISELSNSSKSKTTISSTTKTKSTNASRQRSSKSSLGSTDEEESLSLMKKNSNEPEKPQSDKEKSDNDNSANNDCAPPADGGTTTPAPVVEEQLNLTNKQTNLNLNSNSIEDNQKNPSIFSPCNSSESDINNSNKKSDENTLTNTEILNQETDVQVSKPNKGKRYVKKKMSTKKEETKPTNAEHFEMNQVFSSGMASSTDGTDTDQTGDSAILVTGALPKKLLSTKPSKSTKGIEVSDLEKDSEKTPIKGTLRTLTRSSSTRKSLHLLGKTTDTDTDVDLEKRSSSKSPVKKPAVIVTKSKAKTIKSEPKVSTLDLEIKTDSPSVTEEQKCPIEGCDSSGHLSGNLDKHFLLEACPIYHNISVSECKERAIARKRMEEDSKNVVLSEAAKKKYQTMLHETSIMLQNMDEGKLLDNDIKEEKPCDKDREPNLNGFVSDYDLQLFREAQAIASEQIENEVKTVPVGKGIKYITMGKYEMKVWYQSPYPDDAARMPKMYICEYCLRYQKSEISIKRHAEKCIWRHPPGDEIYRKSKLQVWQVDGKRHKQYCQHLCLLAKFFLDHKTLYYDVEPFLFYVMTLADSDGCHTVGYFSKEKNSFYNVSCILTLPPYQRKGYGRLLIDFSYLLTRVEGKIGSPEKPLSDLGLISYRSYWKDVLLEYLCTRTGTTLSIKDVSKEMAIYSYDIVSTLQALGMMKYWKGKHIVLKKQDVIEEFEERMKRRGNFPKIDASCLRWSPFIPTQSSNCSS